MPTVICVGSKSAIKAIFGRAEMTLCIAKSHLEKKIVAPQPRGSLMQVKRIEASRWARDFMGCSQWRIVRRASMPTDRVQSS
jgi:hypothetical protein